MFTKESVKKGVATVALVLVALAIHQKFIAPRIAGKKPVAKV